MSNEMLELFRQHKPVENPEFGGKKKLNGDAVATVESLGTIVAKSGKEWIMLKCQAIHAIPDPKGRDTSLKAGDELTKFYDPQDAESISELSNDLFTAGIDVNAEACGNTTELIEEMGRAAKDKLVYFRTWTKDKTADQIAKSKPGKPNFYQNVVIKSKNLITPENSTPELSF